MKHRGSPNETVECQAVHALRKLADQGGYFEKEKIQAALVILRDGVFDNSFERAYMLARELDEELQECLQS